MHLTEKNLSAERTDQAQRGQILDVPGRVIGQVTVFLVAWFVTYNKAYLMGDDVDTFNGNRWLPMFLPRLQPEWIPNRVVDLYGRSLLVHVFDVIYFSAKSLFGADFFFVYKIFNATLFAIFLCFVYRYFVELVLIQELSLREGQLKLDGGVLPSLFIAFVTLSILPFTTEVVMVCYQVPAFLSFVVLAELFKLMPRFSVPGLAGVPTTWLMTLSFVVAFSLEAYSAIILAAIIFAWVLNYRGHSSKDWRSQAFIVSGLLGSFCVAALGVTVRYSQRPLASEKSSPTRQIIEFFVANKLLPYDAKLYCGFLIVGVLGALLLAAFLLFYRRLVRDDAMVVGGLTAVLQRRFSLIRWTLFFLIVLFPTMIAVSLISLETDYNYFSFSIYPWGGLLLIAAFFAVPAIVLPTLWFLRGNFLFDMARIFLMMLFISGAATHAMRESSQSYYNSMKVLNAYRAARRNLNSTAVFDTGLSLDSLPRDARPLPTARGPSVMIRAYHEFFKKYYDVNTKILFK
jgi:hypothetical protein